MTTYILPFERIGIKDIEQVGGKNASLGEMIASLEGTGVRVPTGFASTAQAYRDFLAQDGLDGRIEAILAGLDVDDIAALSAAGRQIRELDPRHAPASGIARAVAGGMAGDG